MKRISTLVLALALLGGCQSNGSNVPSAGPPPVSGGTLELTRDGRYAIASDPDRAALHIVDLVAHTELHRIDLGPNDEPGRVVEDDAGRIHVVLRRAGQVLTVDRERGTITDRRDVCAAPRGIAVVGDELVVACAEGVLARLPAAGGAVTRRVKVEPDLRDVVVAPDGRLLVSRFRSAELLILDGDTVVDRMRPPSFPGRGSPPRDMEATVAWRLRPHPEGALMIHQHSQSSQLGTLGVPSGQYYGGSCDLGVLRSAVTIFDIAAGTTLSAPVDGASLVVDGDDLGSGTIYLAAASEPGVPRDSGGLAFGLGTSGVRAIVPTSLTDRPELLAFCPAAAGDPLEREEAAIAVVARPGGGFVVQFRDPGQLVLVGGTSTSRERVEIPLSGGRAENLGHAIFHEAAGSGATCAGCHPEGADDGHVWLFDVGARRTQTLTGGILETAPFHWRGDVLDATSVMGGTFVGRMGGQMPRADEVASFERWVDALPATPAPSEDTGMVERGSAAFAASGCGDCHSGERRTNNATLDVGTGGVFQVPGLYEVVYHAPYFHDGSARTLEDVLARHGETEAMSDTTRADVVAYLRSL
jgi:hypothetical protein